MRIFGVIIINVHVIIYYWKGQSFIYLKHFFFLIIFLNLGKKLFFFENYKKIKSDFPRLVIWV